MIPQGMAKILLYIRTDRRTTSDLYQEDPEVGSPQIQGEKLFSVVEEVSVVHSTSMH